MTTLLTNVHEMASLHDQLTVYIAHININTRTSRTYKSLTSVLDTVLRKDAMAPIAHAAHRLDGARAVRRARVQQPVIQHVALLAEVQPVEPLAEPLAHVVPRLAVRVLCSQRSKGGSGRGQCV